jgi:hypothetical protein
MRDIDAPSVRQILNVPQRKRMTDIHPTARRMISGEVLT